MDNYIDLHPIDTPFPFGDRVTVEMWLRGAPREAHQFFATDNARYKRLLSVHVPYSDGNVYFDGGGDDSNNFDRIVKKLEASDTKDTWSHWAFVRDSSAGRMAIYKNGMLWHEASGMTRSMLGCTRFAIGAYGNGNWPHQGATGEFRVWSVARTAAQISGNMNRRIPAGDTSLIASYALDQAATTISDRSGNGCHGALRGRPVTVAGPTLA